MSDGLKSRWKEGLREASTEQLEDMVKTIQGIIDERGEKYKTLEGLEELF